MRSAKSREQEMLGLLGRWSRSGESLWSFSNRTGESYQRLRYWRVKLGVEAGNVGCEVRRRGRDGVDAMVPVRIIPEETRPPRAGNVGYLIRLPSGIELEIPRGFDSEDVAHMLGLAKSC